MKILITGICGFVGSTLARLWTESDSSVTIYGIDNLGRKGSQLNRESLERMGIRVLHGDIRVQSDFESLPAPDFLIDAAANPSVLAGVDGRTSSRQVVEHNLLGTVNMLEFCKAHRAGFVLISTSRVYSIDPLTKLELDVADNAFVPSPRAVYPAGLSKRGLAESFSTASPVSLYGGTKLASEIMALEYAGAFGLPVWINRCGVLGGPGQFGHAEQGIFSFWIHSWRARRPLKYIGFGGAGYQVRDVFHPRDLLIAIQKQIASSDTGSRGICNFSGGADNAMSLANLSQWCEERWGKHEVGSQAAGRQFDIPWMVLDNALAATRWNWRPSLTVTNILQEIAEFAEQHPHWLDISKA